MPELALYAPTPRAFPRVSARRRRHLRLLRPAVETKAQHWEPWAREIWPEIYSAPFADHHREMWEWGESFVPGLPLPPALVAILPRGGAKTTTMEGIGCRWLALGKVRCLAIVSSDLFSATDRVRSIRTMLEDERFRERYPIVGERAINPETGAGIAWSKYALLTASGQMVRAASLQAFQRGMLFRGQRPDAFFFDDIDKTHDTEDSTLQKCRRISAEVLPSFGSKRGPVLFAQNLISSDGVAARFVDGRADFLARRKLIGPIPAIRDMRTESYDEEIPVEGGTATIRRHKITGGTASWGGQPIERIQAELDDGMGLSAVLWEMQHECFDHEAALLSSAAFRHVDPEEFDRRILVKRVVGVDPSGGAAECGIVACGRDSARQLYVLQDASMRITPKDDWAEVAIITAARWGASIVAETNYGGVMVTKALEDAKRRLRKEVPGARAVKIAGVDADMSKEDRAHPVRGAYLDGRIIHVGKHARLEREWTVPWKKSPNRLDAEVHAINVLDDRQAVKPAPEIQGLGDHAFIG